MDEIVVSEAGAMRAAERFASDISAVAAERFVSLIMSPANEERIDISSFDADLPGKSRWPMLHEVPQGLRDTHAHDFKEVFEPRMISFGPYHHDKPELKPAETLKLRWARRFILDGKLDPNYLFGMILGEMSELRKCYKENSAVERYRNEDLAGMMMVDGCSLLHFIYSHKMEEDLLFNPQTAALVKHDMFLLENQLPFRVLELLSYFQSPSSLRSPTGWMVSIEKFICGTFKVDYRAYRSTVDDDRIKKPPSHLLDLLRRILLLCGGNKRIRRGRNKYSFRNERNTRYDNYSFRNVGELKAAGIRFRPNESDCLRDISFEPYMSFFGVLQLPRILVDDSTKWRLLNLVAYEMCSAEEEEALYPEGQYVTSYLCFLDSLIYYPEDVKELRRQKILTNFFGSDERVVELFHEMVSGLVDTNTTPPYVEVKRGIQRHYQGVLVSLMTQWNVAAFVGAISFLVFTLLGLVFTALQTYFTIFPRK